MGDYDFKIIFIHRNPDKIVKGAHQILQEALNDRFFHSKNGEIFISIVCPPKINDGRNEDNPHIEFCLGIGGGWKHIGCIYILEHLMRCIQKSFDETDQKQLTKLKYFALIPSSFVKGVTMAPFKEGFEVVNRNNLEQLCFGNIHSHNKLFIQRRITAQQETSEIMEWKLNEIQSIPIKRKQQQMQNGRSISADSGNDGSPLTQKNIQKCKKQQSYSPENNNSSMQMMQRSLGENHQDSGMLEDIEMENDKENIEITKRNKITAEFEHDLKLLNITFLVPFFGRHIDQVLLRIKYSSISQICIQFERRNSTKFWMRMMFRIKYPPEIHRTNDVFQFNGKTRSKKGKCYRVLGWGEDAENVKEDVKNSPVLVLDFEEIEAIEVSAILGRLIPILKLDLQLRNMEEKIITGRPQINLLDFIIEDAELYYWIEALGIRGSVVLDHWFYDKERDKFFEFLTDKYYIDRKRTIDALEKLADKLIERPEIRHRHGLKGLFEEIIEELTKNNDDVEMRNGYERVKKVIITPSRILFSGHEILMGNRVLRLDKINYPPEKFLRVIFRDEDGQRIRKTNSGDKLIDEFITATLNCGFKVTGKEFHFLGTSNSQMRDGGCYFLQGSFEEVINFRKRLGQFDALPSVPKMISRLGLCFTQAREIKQMDMRLQMIGIDFIGGKDSNNENYIFSDGCGCMSMSAALEIADEFGFDKENIPSCYQFRYAGYKGVLSVNPKLDEAKKWWNGLTKRERAKCGSREDYMAVDFYFRPSQKKFSIIEEEERKCTLEIVKYSAPSQVYFNRPFINILDQVSKMHSTESHLRICNRIHSLLDKHIFNVCSTFTDEYCAKSRLAELQQFVGYDCLQTVQFTREPFFRLVLRAAAKMSLHKLLQKLSIAIPKGLGRVMFGIVDETDSLQHGQVFVQYSEELFNPENKRRKGKGLSRPKILKGRVMITKSPTVVGGDVRMFEAIDVPSLHHLNDVVVFPRFGPRPHTDEMAGSDLDGDEYAVIWDPELALERNEPAADYSPVREEAADSQNSNEIDIVDFHTEMAAFFVNYLKNDSIGRISNAHLFNSDLYGLNAQVCASIARKHQQALDFSKTGKPPKELRNDWSQDDPPERFERAPDFNLKGIIVEPQYVSPRLNGQLFRRAKELSNFVTASISKEIHNNEIEEDKWLLSKEGHEEYLQRAQQCYDDYAYSMKNLMDNYGIICEGELFSSTYSVLRNKLSEQEGEDMSFYTTTKIINDKLKCIVNEAREEFFFFAVFGGCEEEFTNEDGICEEPTEEMQILARAYYTISYLTKAEKRCFLSFPWIACWDILDFIKRSSLMAKGRALFTFDPFGDRISEYIQQFLAKNSNAFLQFKKKMIIKNENKSEEIFEWKEILRRYSQRHKGLDKLMFFCVEWAKYKQIFEQTPLREEHICLLLISYGLLILPNAQILSEKSPWLIETPAEWIESPQNPKHSIKQIGRRFCSFLEGLASRQFLQLPNLHFEHLGLNNSDFFGNGEWRPICRIAMATYQHLVFADRLDGALPPLDENAMNIICPNEELMEGTVFQIELPGKRICEEFINDENLLQKLCSKTECQQIVMRRHPRIFYNRAKEPKPMRVLISSWGRREALERLFELFAIHPKSNLNTNRRLQIQMIPEETFEKLDHILNGPKRQRELDLPELEFEDEENEMDDVQMALALPIEDEYSTDEDVVYDDDDYLDDEE